jgi:hypothetical protein
MPRTIEKLHPTIQREQPDLSATLAADGTDHHAARVASQALRGEVLASKHAARSRLRLGDRFRREPRGRAEGAPA